GAPHPWASHLAFHDASELRRQLGERLLGDRHGTVLPADDDVHRAEVLVRVGILDARVRAAAVATLQRRRGDRTAHGEQAVEVPPSRFEPWRPPATSPAAKRPGTVAACVSASTRTPPIM